MTTQAQPLATSDTQTGLSAFEASLLAIQRQQTVHLRTIKNLLWWLILWLPLIAMLLLLFPAGLFALPPGPWDVDTGIAEPSGSDRWYEGWVGATLIVVAALSAVALVIWAAWTVLRAR